MYSCGAAAVRNVDLHLATGPAVHRTDNPRRIVLTARARARYHSAFDRGGGCAPIYIAGDNDISRVECKWICADARRLRHPREFAARTPRTRFSRTRRRGPDACANFACDHVFASSPPPLPPWNSEHQLRASKIVSALHNQSSCKNKFKADPHRLLFLSLLFLLRARNIFIFFLLSSSPLKSHLLQ